ncbi:MAG: deaminase [Proteobacteria bacterium]|nr:deaminase [Pseudomonadota bacterium]
MCRPGHNIDFVRRAVLARLPALTLACALPLYVGNAGHAKAQNIEQPAEANRRGFMQRAAEMRRRALARGDQGYGAVVVRDGRVVGEGVSAVIVNNDPTAHAEMEAIRDACRRLGTRDLSGCELYGTSRACPMCESAAYWAGISRLLAGDPVGDYGAPRLPQR